MKILILILAVLILLTVVLLLAFLHWAGRKIEQELKLGIATNESVYADFLLEIIRREEAVGEKILLNPEFVIDMLTQIENANNKKLKINPKWLRAEKEIWLMGTPLPKNQWVYKRYFP